MEKSWKFVMKCMLAALLFSGIALPAFSRGESPEPNEAGQVEKTRTIIGKIIDTDGHPLPGATVLFKGSTHGVVSDMEGKFIIDVPDRDVTLQISFIGMETKEFAVSQKETKEITITLKQDSKQMDEVVVTGFANLRKESFTGNTVTIKKDDLQKVSQSNIISAIQTFDPSFRIAENSAWGSDPNATPEVYIRGKSAIGTKELDVDVTSKSSLKNNPNLPTFIMDGFEISVTKLYDMDPSRIESVTILKDAAATAMYGSRAANGVVVITTVTPKPGKLNVSYSLAAQVEMPDLRDYNLMDAAEKLETERLAGVFEADNTLDRITNEQIYNAKLYNVMNGVNTYWLGKPLHSPFNHNHSLYIDGGSDKLRFGIELNLNNENGVMKGSKRYNRSAGAYIQYAIGNVVVRDHFTYGVNRSSESDYGLFSDYTKQLPYDVYKDENGDYLEQLNSWMNSKPSYECYNPLYEATLGNYGRSSYDQIINNLSVQWNICRDLLLKSTLGMTRQFDKSETFLDPRSRKNTTPLSKDNPSSGSLNTNAGNSFSLDWQASLSYNRFVGKHNVNASLGINIMTNQSKSIAENYKGFPAGNLSSPNYAQELVGKPVQNEDESRLIGLTGLVNYSYDNIYLFDASIRMDGSSKFGSDKKYAPFWSGGVGINIHNYKPMQELNWLDLLKVRASYGQVGKVNFASYDAKTTYRIFTDQWYKTGYGATLYAHGNPHLKWETTNTLDAGLEISVLRRLFYLRGSYYIKRTVDCINSVTIPSHTGFTTYMDNVGEIENKGFELDFRTNFVRTKDWNVTVFANLAHNENKLVKIAESLKAYNDRVDAALNDPYQVENVVKTRSYRKYAEGMSQSAIWGMQSLGIDPATGDELFRNPDGTVTRHWNSMNQVVVGDEEPVIQGTFGFNVVWKRFSLYTTCMYECGGQRYNSTLVDKVEGSNIAFFNADKRVLTGRWKQPGDLAPYKNIAFGYGQNITTKATSRFVQDYNWWNINSVTLEYDFNPDLIKSIGLTMLRVGIGANDLARFSSVKQERGLNYPYSRTVNFTVKLSF